MADSFDIDFSDLNRLVADLGEVQKQAPKFVHKALEVSSRHIKDDWRRQLQGSSHIPAGPYAVSYDVKADSSSVSAEIGPEVGTGGVGGLVGALEYGIPGKTGPTGYGHAALQKNQADFEKGLSEALKDAEKAAGL